MTTESTIDGIPVRLLNNGGAMRAYHMWRPTPDITLTVEGPWRSIHDAHLVEEDLPPLLRRDGYQPPRWWQWWRWREQPLPAPYVPEVGINSDGAGAGAVLKQEGE